MIKLINAKCPNCAGNLQVPDDLEKAYCMYCGSTVIIDKKFADAVHLHFDGNIVDPNVRRQIERQLKKARSVFKDKKHEYYDFKSKPEQYRALNKRKEQLNSQLKYAGDSSIPTTLPIGIVLIVLSGIIYFINRDERGLQENTGLMLLSGILFFIGGGLIFLSLGGASTKDEIKKELEMIDMKLIDFDKIFIKGNSLKKIRERLEFIRAEIFSYEKALGIPHDHQKYSLPEKGYYSLPQYEEKSL